MTPLHFVLVFYPFHQQIHKEVIDIKNTLEIMGCKSSLYFANKNLINHFKSKRIDFVLNLARNEFNTRKNEAIAALCELLELKMIGPNLFSSSISNNRDILFKILKYHKVPCIVYPEKNVNNNPSTDIIDIFLLGNENQIIFTNNTSKSKVNIDNIIKMSKKIYNALHCSDYCQISYSLSSRNKFFFRNINLQPFLANHNDFAKLAQSNGIEYRTFINIIVLNAFLKYDTPIPETFTPTYESVFKKYRFLQDIIAI